MNLKDLITKVSAETDLPAAQVRKVANAVLETLRASVEAGENFTSPLLAMRSVTTKAGERVSPNGEKVLVPERKIGRLVPKEPKAKAAA